MAVSRMLCALLVLDLLLVTQVVHSAWTAVTSRGDARHPGGLSGRFGHAAWFGENESGWSFGGWGYDISSESLGRLNDLYRADYERGTRSVTWHWNSGSSLSGEDGLYNISDTAVTVSAD